jgi:2,3-dihydroxybenzoate decarboxylase
MNIDPDPPYRRIATEEAWSPPRMMDMYRAGVKDGAISDPGFLSLWGHYLFSDSERAELIRKRITDLDDVRLADMDAAGIHRQIVALTAPGVQIFDTDTAVAFAREANDELAERIARHPDRFAGLAAAAPQDPAAAAREIERAVKKLGFKGVIVNSHTHGEYLDDQRFWPIFEAAQALDAPVYLHPGTPPADMIKPFLERGLDGAIYGFAVETGMHLLAIIISGAFDRFPALKVLVGHAGEALPFWLYRLEFMHNAMVKAGRYPTVKPLKKRIGDYLRENVWVTTSGMAWEPAIMFLHQIMGADHLMYAMDYPYQYVPGEVAVSDALPMDVVDKKKFFQENAELVFKL